MFISEEVRKAIWKNSERGTFICHPAKTGGTALADFFKGLHKSASITSDGIKTFSNSSFEKKRIKFENTFVQEVNSGKEWSIKLGHQKLSTDQLLDFPTHVKILMPYRNLYSRIKSLVAFNYVLFSQMKKSSLIFTADGVDLISPRKIQDFKYLGERATLEVSGETFFKYKDLFPEISKGFVSSILESERYISLLEKGDVEIFLNGLSSMDFFYGDILGDLISRNKASENQFKRIMFIDMVDLDKFIFRSYKKHLPIVNKSNYSILPKLLNEKLESKDFEEEVKSRFQNEILIEKELMSQLWAE